MANPTREQLDAANRSSFNVDIILTADGVVGKGTGPDPAELRAQLAAAEADASVDSEKENQS